MLSVSSPRQSDESLMGGVSSISISDGKPMSMDLRQGDTRHDYNDVFRGIHSGDQVPPLCAIGMRKSQTLQSLTVSSTSTLGSDCLPENCNTGLEECVEETTFGADMRRITAEKSSVPVFNKEMRKAMEPHLRRARLLREKARTRTGLEVHASIASSVGVPYVRLRQERPFLFDVHTHPIPSVLAETIGVDDLSQIHNRAEDLQQLFEPLTRTQTRQKFHRTYDGFVTSFCIPLLHSIAMAQNIFHTVEHESHITYRYQAFPTISVSRPGDVVPGGPRCDTGKGHSIAYLHFHIPLTATKGTSSLYIESHPGKEDWHPLAAKSVGLGYLFDGARSLHFNLENTTEATVVTLDFVVAIYNSTLHRSEQIDGESLCNLNLLEDRFSSEGPCSFYDEATIDARGNRTFELVAKKFGSCTLLKPDYRVGFPFSKS